MKYLFNARPITESVDPRVAHAGPGGQAADVPRDAQRLNMEHREILAACQAGDPVRAANAVRHHLQQTVVHIMKVLEEGRKA